jgi:ribosomal protein S18 acetylase RimI-like enzyme
LEACIAHGPRAGLSKIELTVYTSNTAAIALYRRCGFTEIGVVSDYRRLDGEVYHSLLMERFL